MTIDDRPPAGPTARSDVTLQRVGREAILHDGRNGQAHVINGSAAQLWELCDGRPLDELVAAFGALYGRELPKPSPRTSAARSPGSRPSGCSVERVRASDRRLAPGRRSDRDRALRHPGREAGRPLERRRGAGPCPRYVRLVRGSLGGRATGVPAGTSRSGYLRDPDGGATVIDAEGRRSHWRRRRRTAGRPVRRDRRRGDRGAVGRWGPGDPCRRRGARRSGDPHRRAERAGQDDPRPGHAPTRPRPPVRRARPHRSRRADRPGLPARAPHPAAGAGPVPGARLPGRDRAPRARRRRANGRSGRTALGRAFGTAVADSARLDAVDPPRRRSDRRRDPGSSPSPGRSPRWSCCAGRRRPPGTSTGSWPGFPRIVADRPVRPSRSARLDETVDAVLAWAADAPRVPR